MCENNCLGDILELGPIFGVNLLFGWGVYGWEGKMCLTPIRGEGEEGFR